MASSAFTENVDLLGSIRSILENYPFSAGLLRELLQNTDDAGATIQTFLLDCRTYPHQNVCDPGAAESQGPALLAFNNALFLPEDWVALQNISRSSKKADTSKIGKFGIGIRSCYHVTDFLQILSGQHLGIFDPQRSFSEDGGIRFTLEPGAIDHIRDHFSAFGHFLPAGWNGEPFDGTIVRLPLRTQPGEIREKTVSPREIEQLFIDFIHHEINVSMLFLQHLRSIELIIVDADGNLRKLGSCTIESTQSLSDGVYKKIVRVQAASNAMTEEEWLVTNQESASEDALTLLSTRAGTLSEKVLKKHKLRPTVGIAFPLGPAQRDIGQLFTFLRLPLPTGFPAHVHAFFALTPSRQNLRYHPDKDVVKGSDDQILDEWNKLLFEVFIPRSWSTFLAILVKYFPGLDIFAAWPTPQSLTTYGESAYWQAFPQSILDIVLDSALPVWPALGQATYHDLHNIFVASPQTDAAVLRALSNIGLNICKPVPSYIFDMIAKQPRWQYRILTPENVSKALKADFVSRFKDPNVIETTDFKVILHFLLSTGNLINIVDLAIVPTVSGEFVALVEAGRLATVHTFLELEDVRLFQPCDKDAIHINDLPSTTIPLFRTLGPVTLNVAFLDVNKVIEYLALHPTRRGVDLSTVQAGGEVIAFLSDFWLWFDVWPARAGLMLRLENLYMLPCEGRMKQADRAHPILKSIGIERVLHNHLTSLGVPFVANNLAGPAQKVLEKYGLLKSVCDVHTLLDRLEALNIWAPFSENDARALMKHFNKYMVNHSLTSYSETQVSTFRRLPIFPVVEYQENGAALTLHRRRIAVSDIEVYGIRSFDFVPSLPNTVFVDANQFDHRLLRLLNESSPSPVSDMDILDLCFQRLNRQPRRLLSKMLEHLVTRRNWILPNHLYKLRSEPFVSSCRGTLEMPQSLIDPSSPLYPLFVHDHHRLPRKDDELDRHIIGHLSALQLLDNALTADNVVDRIRYIAANSLNESSVGFSIQLLNILYDKGFPCDTLNLDRSIAWLPTQKSRLANARECRPNTSADELYLFDRVLDLVHSSAKISPSLPRMLGWADPIPIDILIKQLRLVLEAREDENYPRVKRIIKELVRRNLSSGEQDSLRGVLDGRAWVPTAEYGRLVESWQAVFSSAFLGVYNVSLDLTKSARSRDFLLALGCSKRPSFETVRRRLSQLSSESLCPETTTSAIAVLKFVATDTTLDLSDEERSQLLVPDDGHRLRLIDEIVFNDVGSRVLLANVNDLHIASPSIDDALARSLNLERLGLKFVHLQTPGEDMGVTPATVVKKTLGQYTERQFLPEFLANAEDAGASQLVVILNDFTPTIIATDIFMSPALGTLCNGPSVMVFNDKEFSDADFAGICRTNIGSKGNDPDSIGQFGLGALTMFHVTECAIIYSGEKVLFLDPSKTHLPMSERASVLLPLDNLLKWYPGHGACLNGLECFDNDAKRVNGTIFFLPLRKESHFAGREPFVEDSIFTAGTFQSCILDDFKSKASDCLLFVKLGHVEARTRTSAGTSQLLWSFTAQRTETDCGGFLETKISIQQRVASGPFGTGVEWLTVSASLAAGSIPPEHRTANSSKILRVGLAALMSDAHQFRSKFFCMLPLAIPATLPVHVNASFRMSPDRRQIRLDAYDNDDTRFNRWLLTEKLDPLYLELLERIGLQHDNSSWWPGAPLNAGLSTDEDDENIPTAHEDALTSTLITSFYSKKKLPQSPRRIFTSMYTEDNFKFSDIVLYSSRTPAAVRRALKLLAPPSLVKLPARVRLYVKQAGAEVVSPKFLRQVLSTGGAEAIREALGPVELDELLVYLGGSDPTHLLKLPLLSLMDNTWAMFETGGEPYYIWREGTSYLKKEFFPPGRFVSTASVSSEFISTLEESSINVHILDAPAIKTLTKKKLDTLGPREKADWVAWFWRVYEFLPRAKLLESIETLELVPGTPFRSLSQCKNNAVLLKDRSEEEIGVYLHDMGITVVATNPLPSSLRELLRFGDYTSRTPIFSRFLDCVSPVLNSAIHALQSWTPERQEFFSKWVRDNITSKLQNDAARRLPVWTARKGNVTKLCSANEVALLPSDVLITAGRFCDSFMTVDVKVQRLGRTRLSIAELVNSLHLPTVLEAGDDESIYKSLLDSLLNSNQVNTIRVPNAHRIMVSPSDLSETTPFFIAAYGATSPHFLLPSFDSFASRLYSKGLKREGALDINVFAECAKALHDDGATNKLARGRVIYSTYCETLPLHVPSGHAARWHNLDQYRFIPRSGETTRQYGSRTIELPARIRELPNLVSPSEVVQSKHYPIAWTQRVGLATEPNERLLLAFPKFGVPSGEEVIAHLKALSAYPRGPIIIHDLKATYKWLTQNIAVIDSSQLKNERVFLNVDDPDSDEWRWSAANEMALETHDVGTIQEVRKFLKPFRRLLKATGVLEAVYPELEPEAETTLAVQDQTLLKQMREGFAEMRQTGQFADVCFVPEEESLSVGVEDSEPSRSPIDPNLLRGHRIFLAVCNPTFKDMFTGAFTESQQASSNDPQTISLSYSGFAIKAALDFLYTGTSLLEDESVELYDLLETLGLAHYLDIRPLFNLAQRVIIKSQMVDPQTLEAVRSSAQDLRADVLRRWCDAYQEQNSQYISAVQS